MATEESPQRRPHTSGNEERLQRREWSNLKRQEQQENYTIKLKLKDLKKQQVIEKHLGMRA